MTSHIDASRRNAGWLSRCGAGLKVAAASALFAGTVLLSALPQRAEAAPGDRALNVLNVHTNQQATVVFKRGGRYDPAGLKQLNYLLRDWRKDQPTNMDPHLFDLIWEVYRQSGSRQPIHVVCGYRSPTTNAMLRSRSRGVAQHSQHMLGKAMDFYLADVPLAKVREIGLRMQVGGVGFYPTSGSPFVHMDTGSVRHWPRMTRQQLVRVFPNGKTLHIPSDGKPLPGYEQALAEYNARKSRGGEIVMASAEQPAKGKSFLGKLFGGGADEEEDTADVAPAAKQAPVAASDAGDDSEAAPAAPAAAATMVVAEADMPLPRPSPVPHAADEASSDETMAVAEADIPLPRPSPVARPMVAMANVAGDAAPTSPRTAADAIADAVGRNGNSDAPLMAYASVDSATPHIDASSGAIVAGRAAGLRSTFGRDNAAEARLVPVGYSVATLQLVMQAGSTREMDQAPLAMPHPFSLPEFFAAADGPTRSHFGRVAYNQTLRASRDTTASIKTDDSIRVASN